MWRAGGSLERVGIATKPGEGEDDLPETTPNSLIIDPAGLIAITIFSLCCWCKPANPFSRSGPSAYGFVGTESGTMAAMGFLPSSGFLRRQKMRAPRAMRKRQARGMAIALTFGALAFEVEESAEMAFAEAAELAWPRGMMTTEGEVEGIVGAGGELMELERGWVGRGSEGGTVSSGLGWRVGEREGMGEAVESTSPSMAEVATSSSSRAVGWRVETAVADAWDSASDSKIEEEDGSGKGSGVALTSAALTAGEVGTDPAGEAREDGG
jgi:hypothetical protein